MTNLTEVSQRDRNDFVVGSLSPPHHRTQSLPLSESKARSPSAGRRLRHGQSPFFAGLRQNEHCSRGLSPGSSISSYQSSIQGNPSGSSPESRSSRPATSPTRDTNPTTQSLPATSSDANQAEDLIGGLLRVYSVPLFSKAPPLKTSGKQGPPGSVLTKRSKSTSPFPHFDNNFDLRAAPAPRRVLRPDDWWREAPRQPPTVPSKSPLRSLLPHRVPIVCKTWRYPSSEEKALWEELSPPPLVVRRSREESNFVGSGSKVQSDSPIGECSHTAKLDHQKQPAIGLDDGTEIFSHRRQTLEILVSSPVSATLRPAANRLSLQQQQHTSASLMMNSLHPDSAAALTAHRREAIRLAETQQRAVSDKCKRSKQAEPDYAFDELIGKGSFGRVYKG